MAPEADAQAKREPIVSYSCPIAGTTHTIPGPDVRILKTGDGGFVVACNCGPESLDEADSRPHPTVDHLVNIYADDPAPEQWLRLEDAAEGWYAVNPWTTPEGFEGTRAQRRAQFRSRVEEIADDDKKRSQQADEYRQARKVACPKCGADPGQKCQRPSGHRVREPHASRVDRAGDQGVLEDAEQTASHEQTGLKTFA